MDYRVVGVRRLELRTSTSRTWRATDCATPRRKCDKPSKYCCNVTLSVPNVARYRLRYTPTKMRFALKILLECHSQCPQRGALPTALHPDENYRCFLFDTLMLSSVSRTQRSAIVFGMIVTRALRYGKCNFKSSTYCPHCST